MFDKAKSILENIPKYELQEYLMYTNGDLENTERGLTSDILNKLMFRCKYHSLKGKYSELSTFRVYNTICWLNYMSDKYKLNVKIKEGVIIDDNSR